MTTTHQSINVKDFKAWLKDPVTLAVFSSLSETDEYVKATLASPNVLLGSQVQIAKFVGIREGLQQILNISAEDVQIEETEE